jgi:hypothetical protein
MSTRRTWGPFAAAAVGQIAEGAVTFGLDQVEGLSLWALEQAAVVQPDSALVKTVERRVRRLRPLAAPLPRVARRATAATAYFGICWGPEIVRGSRRVAGEAASFVRPDGPAWRG